MKTDLGSRLLASPVLFWPLCLGGVALIALAVLGPEAERRLAIEDQCARMQAEVDALQQAHDRLTAAEQALRDNPAYAQWSARKDLRLARPGETRLPMPKDRRSAPPASAPTADLPEGPLLARLVEYADPQFQSVALVGGAAMLLVGLILSLPPRPRAQGAQA